MGVPCMRAVLRATFDARRSARPTAAVSILVSLLTLGFFMVLAPILVASGNQHPVSNFRIENRTVAKVILRNQVFDNVKSSV